MRRNAALHGQRYIRAPRPAAGCSPYEWMDHVLGPHSAIGMEGTTQVAAIMAVAARFNAISEGLAVSGALAPFFHNGCSDAWYG
jgi:hypothetical protein